MPVKVTRLLLAALTLAVLALLLWDRWRHNCPTLWDQLEVYPGYRLAWRDELDPDCA